ncbi:unnamed protein product [Ectocarpus sp. CCAP 1310/34]|nr:unnamed protein product [Ectocarpus sp. CCAP 1310/34]
MRTHARKTTISQIFLTIVVDKRQYNGVDHDGTMAYNQRRRGVVRDTRK